ncbi:MAG: hypothetical protein CMM91_05250 [Rickettsiales bacterium]|nr:hypothetical protein [Rickettsiales bacterium]OUV53482.1 MAG: hypothetical protein CBC87_03990 [Rickettsiales bacterium TMED127]|tara:strand:+ start:7594 stop:9711 length:2118 start_codon:yes stop_codon:yes gene_type:complete
MPGEYYSSPSEGSTLSKSKDEKGKNNDVIKSKAIVPNALHQYASYNYIWTLSGLSEEEIRDPKLYKTNPPHDIIARSGGIGPSTSFNNASPFDTPKDVSGDGMGMEAVYAKERNKSRIETAEASNLILKRNHDIFFKRVVMTGSYVPNPDRKLMNFNKLEMDLEEPLGITLFEKLRAAAYNNGYLDHTDAPYLLTLEFVGMDSTGKVIRNPVPKKYYPIKISNFIMNLNAGGTTYSGIAVPWTEFGMSNRFLYTRGQFKVEGNSLREKFDSITEGLKSNQEKEIAKNIKQHIDEYVIQIHPDFNTEKYTGDVADVKQMQSSDFETEGKQTTKSEMQVNPGTAVSKLIESIMLSTPYYNDLVKNVVEKYFGKDGKPSSGVGGVIDGEMVPWFKILTSVQTEKPFDDITKMHKKKIIYSVQPYQIHILNFAVPGLSGADMMGKYVKKDYQYIFTGQNLDILDLDINYKAAFFQSSLTSGSRADTGNDAKDTSGDENANLYYGQSRYPEPELPLRSYPGISSTEDAVQRADKSNKTQEFFDYLINGTGFMVRVEMKIMGDPSFIGDHYAEPIKVMGDGKIQKVERVGSYGGNVWDEQQGAFDLDQGEPLVTLHFRYPTDFDEVSGNYKFKSQEEIQFSGLYKVSRVESTFDNGQFTQILTMVRMNNQKGDKKSAKPLINKEKINYQDAKPKAYNVTDIDAAGRIRGGL